MSIASAISALEALAAAEPLVAEHIAPIIVDAVSMAVREGPTDPDVWVRAFKGAAVYIEALKIDDQWLGASPVYPRPKVTT